MSNAIFYFILATACKSDVLKVHALKINIKTFL